MSKYTTSATFKAMENTLEKLKCLNYEICFVKDMQQKIVAQDAFSIPASNTALQFNHYVGLLKWLISIIQEGCAPDIDEYDDPNIIAQKIMLKLRNLNFDVNFPIAKLKQPHGEVACSILDFLTDKALEVKGFQFGEPRYDINSGENGSSDELDYVDDDSMHSICGESDGIGEFHADANFSSDDMCVRTDDKVDTIMESTIDPIEWRTELERVSPLLKVYEENNHDCEWKGHVNQATSESRKVELEIDASREVFARLHKDSATILDEIKTKEKVINNKFKHLVDHSSLLHIKTKECEKSCTESGTTITELTAELSNITHVLNKTKESVDEKGNSMTDTAPLVQLKTNLQLMKTDIRDYDLQIGLLEQTLLQKRIQERSIQEPPGEDLQHSFEVSMNNPLL